MLDLSTDWVDTFKVFVSPPLVTPQVPFCKMVPKHLQCPFCLYGKILFANLAPEQMRVVDWIRRARYDGPRPANFCKEFSANRYASLRWSSGLFCLLAFEGLGFCLLLLPGVVAKMWRLGCYAMWYHHFLAEARNGLLLKMKRLDPT